jgi:hypothetical protein
VYKENMSMKKESEVLKEPVNKKHILQWHPAFYAGIQIEFEAEADKLTFIREYPLATRPILIDVLIVKKNTEEKLEKNIGRIFRKHNIVEYRKHRRNELYKSVMNIIVRANKEQFEEGKSMCEAILELFQDEVDIATKKAREEGISEGKEQAMTLAIITVLRKKGDVPMSLKEKINKEKNVDVMESWLELTTEVSSIEEFEEKMY